MERGELGYRQRGLAVGELSMCSHLRTLRSATRRWRRIRSTDAPPIAQSDEQIRELVLGAGGRPTLCRPRTSCVITPIPASPGIFLVRKTD